MGVSSATLKRMASEPLTVSIGRLGYRFASAVITLDWRVRPSTGRGVKMLVEREDGALLLVRHTYGNRHWTMPGGRMRSGEEPIETATRELEEELGLLAGEISLLGSYPLRIHRRRERVSVVRCSKPIGEIHPRPIEIQEAQWFGRSQIPAEADHQVALATGLLDGHRAEVQVR
jgi:8-oxo-dGTP pyrophosphatase MutT (NUDIX family)